MRFAGLVRCFVAFVCVACARDAPPTEDTPAAASLAAAGPEISGVWDAVSSRDDRRRRRHRGHAHRKARVASDAIRERHPRLLHRRADVRVRRWPAVRLQPAAAVLAAAALRGRRPRAATARSRFRRPGWRSAAAQNRCDPGTRDAGALSRPLDGDVLTLVSGQRSRRGSTGFATRPPARRGAGRPTRRRGSGRRAPRPPTADEARRIGRGGADAARAPSLRDHRRRQRACGSGSTRGPSPAATRSRSARSGTSRRTASKLSGYYDRIVHQVSTDGHAYRCSMALDFQIATRYQFSGDVRGDEVRIFESSYEVLSPSACDNGKRRLDATRARHRPTRFAWSGASAARSCAAPAPTCRRSGSSTL